MADAAHWHLGSGMGSATPSSTALNTTLTEVTASPPQAVAMASVSQARPSAAPLIVRAAADQEGIARKTLLAAPKSATSIPSAAPPGTPTALIARRLGQDGKGSIAAQL